MANKDTIDLIEDNNRGQVMLTFGEVPDYVNNMYASYKKLADTIYALIKVSGKEEKIIANTDIYKYAAKGNLIYIVEGYFKLLNNSISSYLLYNERR